MTGLVQGTTPYPWPYDEGLARDRTALVVLGWNDAWWHRCQAPDRVVATIDRLAAEVGLVVVVEQPSRTRGAGPERSGQPGQHVHHIRGQTQDVTTVPPVNGAVRVAAAGIDGFFGGPLDAVLRAAGCDLLLLAGLGLETTVHSTMRSANDRGYECLLVIDACASSDAELVPAAVSMVEMSGGIFGAVGHADAVLLALRPTDVDRSTAADRPTNRDHVTAMRGTS